jgi:Cu/Ag efflux protein CusF
MVWTSTQRGCALALWLALGLTGWGTASSAAPTPGAAAALPSGRVGEDMVTATATVQKVDLATRMVTLRRADGSLITFRADERVRNLPQVKVGDEVTATYYEALAYSVKRPGDAAVGTRREEEATRAKLGERPGAAAGRVTTVTTRIVAIDRSAGTVTLERPDGEAVTVKVREPKNLERVAVGDLVEITLTEAVAISVDPPRR